jgi:hypothetical protein
MGDEVVAREALDVRQGADHRHAHGVVAPDCALQHLGRPVLGILLVLDRLLPDHFQLALQFDRRKGAVQDDVGCHRQELIDVLAQAGHEIAGGILASEGVDIGAEPLRVQVDGLHRTRGRALERHVLQDMADPIGGGLFVARSHPHEHADTGAADMGQRDRQQSHPVGKGLDDGGVAADGGQLNFRH